MCNGFGVEVVGLTKETDADLPMAFVIYVAALSYFMGDKCGHNKLVCRLVYAV